jgi:ATP-dependent helicase/DNAse subunit B
MSVTSIATNLSGQFTGVGGVSGAGGGSGTANNGNGNSATNVATSIMLSNMTSMKPQQQQQTLIYLLEQLVTLNHELQRTEAAMGVLDFASKYLQSLDSQTRVKERWYEKLHQWQKALTIYEKELKRNSAQKPGMMRHVYQNDATSFPVTNADELTEARLDLLMGRMRCLKGKLV